MKFVNTILYIEFQELVDAGLNEGSLKNARLKNTPSLTFIDDPSDRRRVLIEYESMKPQYKDLVIQKLCGGLDPYSFLATTIIGSRLISKVSDTEFFAKQDLRNETQQRAIEACRYLFLLERCRLSSQKKLTFPMWSTKEFWNYLIAHIKGNTILYKKNGINLPSVRSRLNHLAKLYIMRGPGVILNGRMKNKNSSKLGKCLAPEGSSRQHTDFNEETYRTQIAILTELRSHPNNLDFVQIADHYNQVAAESNWPSLTNMQVMNILKDPAIDLVTTPGRRGVSTFMNEKAIQVKRQPPSTPLRLVTVDGWDVELAYQEMVPDRHGKMHTRYDNRLVIVIIFDPFMKYPVGYAIDNTESSALIRAAMKNAIDHVFEQTCQYIAPYQIQSDHYAIKDLGPFYASIARMHTPARVGNAKAKVIEPYFRYLNKKYCQLLHNWTGFGIKSRRENQPNMELKDQIKKQFPDRAGVIMQIEDIITAERQAKGQEYFNALVKAEKRLMDRRDYLRALGIPRERTIKANGKGLIMTIDNVEYTYDSLDIAFRKHLTRNWKITYDPGDMRSILVEDHDGQISFILEEKYVQPMAIADQTPEDREKLREIRQSNKDLRENIIEEGKQRRQILEEHFSSDDRLSAFRQKLMFTQNGQQKDPLQEAKGKMLPEEKEKKAIEENTRARKERDEKTEKEINEQEFWDRQEELLSKRVDISKFL
jgi:hypothetical protein